MGHEARVLVTHHAELRKDVDELSLHLHSHIDRMTALSAQLDQLERQLHHVSRWVGLSTDVTFWARLRWLLFGI
jgi:hypothetical protein